MRPDNAALGVLLSTERRRAMRTAGLWPDRLALDHLDDNLRAAPDDVALIDHNSMTGRSTALTWRDLDRRSRGIAVALARAGIEPGDVVAWQLPNWWEFVALHLACLRVGAISNPLMPIFRERELEYMLGFAEARLLVVPARFRGYDHAAMATRLRGGLPRLRDVWVVGGDGPDAFETQALGAALEDAPEAEALFAARRPAPDDVVELLYTSGTTGQPKGVMHTSNTLFGTLRSSIDFFRLSGREVLLMASPMAHQTGFLFGILLPIALGARAVLQDIWDPATAAALVERHRVTWTIASTPFLADLARTPALARHDISSLRVFASGGAPIPRVLVREASERLGAAVCALWGMTENGVVTATRPDDPPDKVFNTDGVAVPGYEVRVVDAGGKPAPTDTEGDLQARGVGLFVGYLKRPDAWGTDAEGWFDTGDRARMDSDGYIRITGRSKDIIIRGGENVPVAEVEELLYRHPAIEAAAVVAMPDERLGERGCAVVTLKPGASLDFAGMVAHLIDQRMSKTYMPEQLVVLAEMPRTASGKIQKFRLRELVRDQRPAVLPG